MDSTTPTPHAFQAFSLVDKVALITGGSKGIGQGIAMAFSQAGAQVVCASRTEAEVVAAAAAIEAATGNRAIGIACDVGSAEQRKALIEQTVATMGGLDILVNNAGGSGPNDPLKTSADDFSSMLDWNVTPAFDLSTLAYRAMTQDGTGVIINISSRAAQLRQKNFSAYGSAKAALSHLTRLLAQDFAPKVRVNAIEPGAIMTEALGRFLSPEMEQGMIQSTPMARMGEVEDIANAALFLASPASSWVTGKILELDGGVEKPSW